MRRTAAGWVAVISFVAGPVGPASCGGTAIDRVVRSDEPSGGGSFPGGSKNAGGASSVGGGMPAAGGVTANGGSLATGGAPATGGVPTTGGGAGLGGAGSTNAGGVDGGSATGGTVSVDAAGFPPCCSSDSECGEPAVLCVHTLCLPPVDGMCWRDDECPLGQRCDGVRICPCYADCSYGAEPGRCVQTGAYCCSGDSDCGDVFTFVPCVNGVCKTPNPNNCWKDSECPSGERCFGAFVCRCGSTCLNEPDTPGLCGE
jgi:hypothetical protein